MIHKLLKTISLIFFSLLLCFLSYKLCYFIAEKYFFDKFFYQKSVTHGYWVQLKHRNLTHSDFGDRAKDIISLQSGDKMIETTDNKSFIITIIGDSYVWGTGIKNNQRFVYVLENMLKKIRPTKIISLAEPGDSILDYYNNYLKSIPQVNTNMFIFTLVDNDILPKPNQQYIPEVQLIIDECQKQFTQKMLTSTNLNNNVLNQKFYDIDTEVAKNPTNLCVIKKVISTLPTNKTLYFIPADYHNNNKDQNNFYSIYKNYLNIYHKDIITSSVIRDNPKYSQYWINNDPYQFLHISQSEGHPSALANQLYADLLYQEITTNPKWGFIK